MSVRGDASQWSDILPDDLVPEIIGLVLNGWRAFEKPGRDDLEVPITKRFCCCLRRQKNRSRLPFRIEYESVELDVESEEQSGRIDLKFCHGYREDVYFAFECKRLNVVDRKGKRRPLAGEYVQEGMMRFVGGKYSQGLDKGGMLGYVMDGDVPAAIDAVGRNISRRGSDLSITNGGFKRSSVRPRDARVKETHHSLTHRRLVLHHLFVAVG